MDARTLTRRDFIKLAGVGGAGLVLGVYLDACTPAPDVITPTVSPVTPEGPTEQPPLTFAPNLFLQIDDQGQLTVTAFRTEMGQGIRTAIAMIVADELDIDWSSVHIRQADADRRYGDQQTGGSVSVSTYYRRLREAGAVARSMLVSAAAAQWEIDPAGCTTATGEVLHPNGTDRLPYGQLVEVASKLEVPDTSDVKMKDDSQLKLIGTDVGHWDAPDILTGKALYGTDIRLPGMLFAVLARCPVFGGSIASYNADKALQVPGVKQVLELEDKLAVVATNTWAAIKGRQALEVTWDEGKKVALDNETMFQALEKGVPDPAKVTSGTLAARYYGPFQAHETMEPPNCTADVRADRAELWAPSQDIQNVRRMVASRLKLDEKVVITHLPLVGGGFGRRHAADVALEAAQISKAVGAPVQVLWTRDDDLQHDLYHPMTVQYASTKLDKPRLPGVLRQANEMDLPTGWWRGVDQVPEAYVTQSFIDETAAALGLDPLELRRQLYKGKALAVIELAAEKAGWGTSLPAGWGRGLGYHATFGVTHVADVVEVSVAADGQVRVERVVCAIDCGRAVNPDNVKAQMEGGIAFGITAALMGGVTIERGRVKQTNFDDAPILRLDQMPKVEVYIVPSDAAPTGVGEMGVPPIIPAVGNAILAATGKRLRRLPFRPEDILAA